MRFATGFVALLAVCFGALPARAHETDVSPRAIAVPRDWREDIIEHEPRVLRTMSVKLGVPIQRVSVRKVMIHGLKVPVNIVTVATPAQAEKLRKRLVAMRGSDFVRLRGLDVVEAATKNALVAARVFHWLEFAHARKTFRIEMRLALVKEHSYMHANTVFNHFIQAQAGERPKWHRGHIRNYIDKWEFQNSTSLYSGSGTEKAIFSFKPEPEAAFDIRGELVPRFRNPPSDEGVPYADIEAYVPTVDRFDPEVGRWHKAHLAATRWWPAKDTVIRSQARLIVGDEQNARARVRKLALFVFARIQTGGPMGSRYGVKKALTQGFGHCWDKSDALITLCRALGIPAYQMAGWVPALKSGHVWTVVFLDNEGWLPIDPTTPWLGTSSHYIPLFRTFDGNMPIVHMKLPTVIENPKAAGPQAEKPGTKEVPAGK